VGKAIRPFLLFVAVVQFFFAIAFFFQWPFAVNLWPFEGTTPLTFIFVSSIFAAAAASTAWAVLSGNLGAIAGIGLDYLTILLPVGVFSFSLSGGDSGMVGYGILCLVGAVFGLALFLWANRIPIPKTPPLPRPLRYIFIFFIIALAIVGGRLVLQVPDSIPWMITPELSVIMGWMFIGALTYFAYALLKPSWANAAGQLAGFLAYDIVLIVPFLQRLPNTPPEQQLGMYIYTAVVLLSGLVAIYYLFVKQETRLVGGGSRVPRPHAA